MLNLQNKIVLITGASSGIGAATAKYFAAQRTKLILAARRIEKIKQLAKFYIARQDPCMWMCQK